jgi:hypothetical protein
MYIYINTFICIYMYVCIYIYIYIYRFGWNAVFSVAEGEEEGGVEGLSEKDLDVIIDRTR